MKFSLLYFNLFETIYITLMKIKEKRKEKIFFKHSEIFYVENPFLTNSYVRLTQFSTGESALHLYIFDLILTFVNKLLSYFNKFCKKKFVQSFSRIQNRKKMSGYCLQYHYAFSSATTSECIVNLFHLFSEIRVLKMESTVNKIL